MCHVILIVSYTTHVYLRLSQMILDKILDGVLDQGRGCLLLFDQAEHDEGYADAIKMIDEVGKVVESLYGKVRPHLVT